MFRTEIEHHPYPFRIDHQSQIMMLGSCFSENMGLRLSEHKFMVSKNPFGTLFHPESILGLLSKSLEEQPIDDWSIMQHDELFLSHQLHSQMCASSASQLKSDFSSISQGLLEELKRTDVLVITLGTAFEYRLKSNKQHVANCHKVPQNQFEKRLSTAQDLVTSFSQVDLRLTELNPDIQVLLTVSPIRHTKDSLALNSASKSTLRVACHQLQLQFSNVHYFPSYEIMMDDLRDYRFYEKDMIHPNEVAIDYIWDYFSQSFFEEKTRELNQRIEQIQRAITHRAFNESSKGHQTFLKRTLSQLQELHQQLPFNAEIERVKSQIIDD